MEDIYSLPEGTVVPASNPYQCGSCKLHSLEEAKDIAKEVLDKGIVITLSEDIALDPAKIKDLA